MSTVLTEQEAEVLVGSRWLTDWSVVERKSHTHGRTAQFIQGTVGLRGKAVVRTSAIVRVRLMLGPDNSLDSAIPCVTTTHGWYLLLGENQGTIELQLGEHG